MIANKTKRICAGEYERTDGVNVVRVFFHELCAGWMAAAEWDSMVYTDILPTKKQAIVQADEMLRGD